MRALTPPNVPPQTNVDGVGAVDTAGFAVGAVDTAPRVSVDGEGAAASSSEPSKRSHGEAILGEFCFASLQRLDVLSACWETQCSTPTQPGTSHANKRNPSPHKNVGCQQLRAVSQELNGLKHSEDPSSNR